MLVINVQGGRTARLRIENPVIDLDRAKPDYCAGPEALLVPKSRRELYGSVYVHYNGDLGLVHGPQTPTSKRDAARAIGRHLLELLEVDPRKGEQSIRGSEHGGFQLCDQGRTEVTV